ncbi:MAG: (2Fe-2S)-binding protein [Rhodospirillaceae bacterium TMED8]|nr:(2Fe-2S)-binding protein [Magnetovibrio sp.]OUT51578.1 MAG: (2Fe-2S)-binding protein [Rhodospirillaceae bacterium TMED8]|tara:strand:- start:342 stop:743 length:402 start_codon:yes stop_codon:yes gene_type:complete
MSWTKVCTIDEVPQGSIKRMWARVNAGVPLLIVHHSSGFTALPPICPHLEEPLEESGTIIGCKLTCTKHLWSWDLDTMELQDEAELPLKTYETKVDGDTLMVFVAEELEYNFDEEGDIDEDEFFSDEHEDDEW